MSGKDYDIEIKLTTSDITEEEKDELLFRAFDVLLSEVDMPEEINRKVKKQSNNEIANNKDLYPAS